MELLSAVLSPRSADQLIILYVLLGALALSLSVGGYLWISRRNIQQRSALAAAKARRDTAMVESSGEGIFELDEAGIVRYANPAASRLLGYESDELIGCDYRRLILSVEPKRVIDAIQRVRYTTDLRRGVGAMLKRKDGRARPVEYKIVPLLEAGQSIGTVFSFADIAERVRLDLMLQDLQITAKVGAWEYQVDNSRLIFTDEVFRLLDLALDVTPDIQRVFAMVCESERAELQARWHNAITSGEGFHIEVPIITARKRRLWVHVIANTERFNQSVLRVHGIFQDVTDRYEAQLQLREARDLLAHDLSERTRLEAQLMQAQKLEALGQLTGGIAHDFNNLLGVIIGSLQLLERSLDHKPDHAKKIHAALRAALRGADLTRHLLAFARRQILEPAVIDLSLQLKSLGELLYRALGNSIEISIESAPELWFTRIDPAHIESAVLNLAINARDAMPMGGHLMINVSNRVIDAQFCLEHPDLQPGHYVCLSAKDAGTGIAPENLPNVFEPFFTTKEIGKGSGLGLSMVLGFAKQSGGTATIESELGHGTTVRIFLPRCFQERAQFVDTGIHRAPMPGGQETILVVEDDLDLRETSAAHLHTLGYHIIQAQNPEHALQILASGEVVDLLFTDIMMPGGMLGPRLAERARELQPNICVLFTTGYANTQAMNSGQAVAHSEVIPKPFRAEELASRVRLLLDKESDRG